MQGTSTIDSLLDTVPEALSEYFLGFAKVYIGQIDYEFNDEETVRNYLQSFEANGCDRHNGEHYVSSVIDKDGLSRAIESQHISGNELYNSRNPPLLRFTSEARLRCVRGCDLLEAGQRYLPPGQRWWITKFYSSDIPSKLEDHIRQNYSINECASDEVVFRSFLMRCSSQDEVILKPKFGSDTDSHYVKMLSQKVALRSAMTALAPYAGLWKDFTYRKLEYILAPHCDEFWSRLFPGNLASLVDARSVRLIEGLLPTHSNDDRALIEDNMKSGILFPRLRADRDTVLEGLLSASGRILTLNLFLHDAMCLGPPAKAMKEILPTSRQQTIKNVFLSNYRNCRETFMIQLSEESFEEISLGGDWDEVEGKVAILTLLQLWLACLRYYIRPRLGRAKFNKSMQPLLEIQGKGKLQKVAKQLGLRLDCFGQTLMIDPNFPVFQHVTGAISGESSGVGDARGAAFLSKRFNAIFRQHNQGRDFHQAPKLATNTESQKSSYRSGRPLQREYQSDRQFLFLRHIYCSDPQAQAYPTSFAIIRDFFRSFFGHHHLLSGETEDAILNTHESVDPSTSPVSSLELDQRSESRYSSPDRHVSSQNDGPSRSSAPDAEDYLQAPSGRYRLASVVSLPPHPAEIEELDNENLWAPGFEEKQFYGPSKKRSKINRQANAKQILSEWLQQKADNPEVVVFYLFKSHEYFKFRKNDFITIKSWLEELSIGRQHYFLVLDGDKLRTIEAEEAVTEATKDRLIFVGDKSSFFVGDKSRELTQGISQSQLDDYISQHDVATGKRKRGAEDAERS